jgi:DNA-binding XRE family transcriptional regulator
MSRKKNPHVGGTLDSYIARRDAREPGFAEGVREAFDHLQLARKVRSLREKRGLTQTELAELIGTRQPAIARLESGRAVPKLELLEKIARALGLRLDVRFVAERA